MGGVIRTLMTTVLDNKKLHQDLIEESIGDIVLTLFPHLNILFSQLK